MCRLFFLFVCKMQLQSVKIPIIMFYNEFGWFISTPFCFVYVCMCLRSFVSEQYILYRILSRHRSTIYYLHLDVFALFCFHFLGSLATASPRCFKMHTQKFSILFVFCIHFLHTQCMLSMQNSIFFYYLLFFR